MQRSSSERHRAEAADVGVPITIGIVTISDSRDETTDISGRYLRDRIIAAGHRVGIYRIVPDDPDVVVAALEEIEAEPSHNIALFNGGTGISRRDSTYEALSGRLEKTLPGFGEIFRMLSWQEIGAAAMLSRATAGVYRNVFVASMPGSPAAVRLAWEQLLEPELKHLAWELTR